MGERLAAALSAGSVVLFSAGLGAGKTTFTKGIARGLGIRETVTSPTYTLISEYGGRLPLYHIDLYRIESPEELENLGLYEILGGGGVSVVEWSEKLGPCDEYAPLRIGITPRADGGRLFEISGLPEGFEI